MKYIYHLYTGDVLTYTTADSDLAWSWSDHGTVKVEEVSIGHWLFAVLEDEAIAALNDHAALRIA